MDLARKFWCTVLGLAAVMLTWAAGCDGNQTPPAPATLRVLAASSLAEAFREVGVAFEAAHPGSRIEFSFAGSNQLRMQLENGGTGDVFVSADRVQMDAAIAANIVAPPSVREFAHNRLAIIVPRENHAAIRTLADLARPGLKVIIADTTVPAGRYARLMLEEAGRSAALGAEFVNGLEANVVSHEQSAAAVVAKIALDEADAAIAYASDAAGGNGLTVIPLPPELEQRAEYVAAVTIRAANAALAARFVEFLAASDATAILVKRGFEVPDAGSP